MANATKGKKDLDNCEPTKTIAQLFVKAFTETDDEWPQVRCGLLEPHHPLVVLNFALLIFVRISRRLQFIALFLLKK